jgi:hypothetical protein
MGSSCLGGMSVWSPVEIGDRQCAAWRFSPHSFYVERVENQWHVLSLPETGGAEDITDSPACSFFQNIEKPESTAWRHFLLHEHRPLQAIPAMPDRPIVIRSDRPLTLLPGESALFYLHIPVFFKLTALGSRRSTVCEEPIEVMCKTWFGDPLTGEICYSLATRLHQTLHSVPFSGFEAVCPLFISNESDTGLAFSKICLHTEAVAVYKGSRLWTNQISVVFKGSEQTTQIQIDRNAPAYENALELVCEAREQTESRLTRRSFSMFKYFGGI